MGEVEVVIGADAHKRTHTFVAADELGREVASVTVPATSDGHMTRFTTLLHLPPMPGHGEPRAKNGPPLAGRGAEAVRDAITAQLVTLPSSYVVLSPGIRGRR
jgi:hypothetical protein